MAQASNQARGKSLSCRPVTEKDLLLFCDVSPLNPPHFLPSAVLDSVWSRPRGWLCSASVMQKTGSSLGLRGSSGPSSQASSFLATQQSLSVWNIRNGAKVRPWHHRGHTGFKAGACNPIRAFNF